MNLWGKQITGLIDALMDNLAVTYLDLRGAIYLSVNSPGGPRLAGFFLKMEAEICISLLGKLC
jgi:hypothetical protein